MAPILTKIEKILTPERTLVTSFALVIIIGASLLCLPPAVNGTPLSFIDALFTATSATCVTGLVVVDTGTKFTLFGQLLILLLIQVGGLGIMTFSTAFLYMLQGRFSISGRDILQETLSQVAHYDLKSLIKIVFLATIIIESVGATLLMCRFAFDMPLLQALYSGIFHAIAAFCNAGFSIYSDNFIHYRDDIFVNVVLILLIVLGGIGFIVIYELSRPRKFASNWQHESLHSRVVITTSVFLILIGLSFFLMLEWNISLKELPWHKKILPALFQSVSARTAGFNTVNLALTSSPTLFLMIILMFIGASPGSCGGGIKTSTFAVISAHIRARFHNQEDTVIFSRRIPLASVSRAITITFFSAILVLIFTLLLSISELSNQSHLVSGGKFIELVFEIVSAFGTVGLSAGFTPNLTEIGRILITILMFMGRLGPLTVALAVGRKEPLAYRLAQEDILIG